MHRAIPHISRLSKNALYCGELSLCSFCSVSVAISANLIEREGESSSGMNPPRRQRIQPSFHSCDPSRALFLRYSALASDCAITTSCEIEFLLRYLVSNTHINRILCACVHLSNVYCYSHTNRNWISLFANWRC